MSFKQIEINILFTFEFINLFPMEIYQNYFKEEIDADQCYTFVELSNITSKIPIAATFMAFDSERSFSKCGMRTTRNTYGKGYKF